MNDIPHFKCPIKANKEILDILFQAKYIEIWLEPAPCTCKHPDYEETHQCSFVFLKVDDSKLLQIQVSETDFEEPYYEQFSIEIIDGWLIHKQSLVLFDKLTSVSDVLVLKDNDYAKVPDTNKIIATFESDTAILLKNSQKSILIGFDQMPMTLMVTGSTKIITELLKELRPADIV